MINAIILVVLIGHLSGVITQTILPCLQMNFDREDKLIPEFSECPDQSTIFEIRSYADSPIQPIDNFQYHLTNVGTEDSCFQTNQLFSIDGDTEIRTQFYWEPKASNEFFEILLHDESTGETHSFVSVYGMESNWFVFSEKKPIVIRSAKVKIEDRSRFF